MCNAKKSDAENPTIRFYLDSAKTKLVELRRSGSTSDTLSLVYKSGNIQSFYTLVEPGGTFLPSKIDNNDIHVTESDVSITLNPAYVKTSAGSAWCRRYGTLMVLSFYIQLNGTMENFKSYKLMTLSKQGYYDIKGIAMSQSDGKAHVLEITALGKDVSLAIKGEAITDNEWIWGTLIIPTLTL